MVKIFNLELIQTIDHWLKNITFGSVNSNTAWHQKMNLLRRLKRS